MLGYTSFTSRRNQFGAPRFRTRFGKVLAVAAAALTVAATLTATGASAQADPGDLAPVPSAGCANPAPAAGVFPQHFAARGRSAVYLQDVPAGAGKPVPLVLDLHGYLEPFFLQHLSTTFGQYGRGAGFITITPELLQPGVPRWDLGQNSADIGYLADLLTHVENTLCVDKRRIYATGLSMGGATTSSLGCQLADRLAAIAPVAGLADFTWCHPARPIPLIAFHGTADPIVSYEGGAGPNATTLPSPTGSGSVTEDPNVGEGIRDDTSIPERAAAWAVRNGCAPEAAQAQIAEDVVLSGYDCPDSAHVQLYSVLGGGHIWFGTPATIFPEAFVGKDTESLSATEIIWDFFQSHPLAGPVS